MTTDKGAPDGSARVTDAELAEIARCHAEVTTLRAEVARLTRALTDADDRANRFRTQRDLAESGAEEAEKQVDEASAALTALGHTEDGRTLAERIADARAETMTHLHAARAEVAERDAQIARLARESDATEAALRAEITAAEKLAADRLHVLRRLEWSGSGFTEAGDEVHECPWCGATEAPGEHGGDCELALAIGAKLYQGPAEGSDR